VHQVGFIYKTLQPNLQKLQQNSPQ